MTGHLLRLKALSINLALFVVMGSAAYAANFTVTALGDGYYYTAYFSPNTLQIHVGDTVTFHNPGAANGGGMHNVNADDNSFKCSASCSGPNNNPDSSPWSFSRTFNTVGTIPFHCDMHGGVGGVGMSGTITVLAAGAPGALAFSSSTYSAAATAGSTSISVTRSGGSSGAVSVNYATSDGTAKAGTDYTAASGMLMWADGDSAAKSFPVTLLGSGATSSLTVNLALSSPTGGATLGTPGTAVLTLTPPAASTCTSDAQTLCLGSSGRFQVRVAFVSQGQAGNASAVPLAANPDSGLFYFFGPDNIEMLIKVLNACAPPFNHYWVFFAATTNVQFTVTVTDTANGSLQTYLNAANHAAVPVQDTNAFATCP